MVIILGANMRQTDDVTL